MIKNSLIRSYQLLLCILCITLFGYCIASYSDAFLPFIIAFFIASILSPLCEFLESKKNIKKIYTVIIITLTMYLMIFYFSYYFIPKILLNLSEFAMNLNVNSYVLKSNNLFKALNLDFSGTPKLLKSLSFIEKGVQNILSIFYGFINGILIHFVTLGSKVLKLTIMVLFLPILTFYFLFKIQNVNNSIYNLVPTYYRQDFLGLYKKIQESILKYLRSQLLICLILALFYGTCFTFMNIDYAPILGIISGLFSFVPFFGIFFSFSITILSSFIQLKSFSLAIYIAALFLCGHIMEGAFITPKIMGKGLNIHPLFIIFGMFLWGNILGFVGILFAIPLTAMLIIVAQFIVSVYKKSKLYKY